MNFGRPNLNFGREWTGILVACKLCLLRVLQLRAWAASLSIDRTLTSVIIVLQNQRVSMLLCFDYKIFRSTLRSTECNGWVVFSMSSYVFWLNFGCAFLNFDRLNINFGRKWTEISESKYVKKFWLSGILMTFIQFRTWLPNFGQPNVRFGRGSTNLPLSNSVKV